MVFNFVFNVIIFMSRKVYILYVGALSFFYGFGPVCRNTPVHCARRVGQIYSNCLQAVSGGWHIHIQYCSTCTALSYTHLLSVKALEQR